MITHVTVSNYKSLANVSVNLGPLNVFVGPNGAGKSNFIDALRFLTNALTYGLEKEISERDGVASMLPPSSGRKPPFNIHLKFLFSGKEAEYYVSIAGKVNGEIRVLQEKCVIDNFAYEVNAGKVTLLTSSGPQEMDEKYSQTELFLPVFYKQTPMQVVLEFLRNAGHYSIYPDSLRSLRKLSASMRLMDEGFNLSSILRNMQREFPQSFQNLLRSMSTVVSDITDIEIKSAGGFLVIRLGHQTDGHVNYFDLSQESDGTLRLLAMLTALHQEPPAPLMTLEEPELNIHPGALHALYEVIKEASKRSQIILSSHSPDLISVCDPDEIRVVEKVNGSTSISPLDERQVSIINDKLFSTSDLLRIEGLKRQVHG